MHCNDRKEKEQARKHRPHTQAGLQMPTTAPFGRQRIMTQQPFRFGSVNQEQSQVPPELFRIVENSI
jgi:hypothetical protein